MTEVFTWCIIWIISCSSSEKLLSRLCPTGARGCQTETRTASGCFGHEAPQVISNCAGNTENGKSLLNLLWNVLKYRNLTVARLHFLYLSAFPRCLTFNRADVKVLCVSGVILKYSNFNTARRSLVTQISDFLLIFMLRAISSVPCTCGMLVRISLNACSKASEWNQESWWSHSAIIKRYTQEQL